MNISTGVLSEIERSSESLTLSSRTRRGMREAAEDA